MLDLLEDLKPKVFTLNQGQQAAADGFMKFLFSQEKEMIISGKAGTGKTHLLGELIDKILPEYRKTCIMMGIEPEYETIEMTATTNKAAEVLSLATNKPTRTIHSLLGIKPKDDYDTGKSKLIKTRNALVYQKMIIFIDEAFMIDTPLLTFIRQGTHNCKIVYIGDHCQLAPVMETVSPVHRAKLNFYELTENMRDANQPALMKINDQLRETVETGVFKPIEIIPGVIDFVNDVQMEKLIEDTFRNQTREARILAYTNPRVHDFNEHIRTMRNLPMEYGVGELLVNNRAIKFPAGMLSVEEEIEIINQADKTEQLLISGRQGQSPITIEVRRSMIRSRLGVYHNFVPIAVDRDHYTALLRFFSQNKDWDRYFMLKGTVPDIRPKDAATVHKAQGSTYETVFIDLADISTCRQPKTVARLLYVAFSRARNRVILHGNLAPKYGGLIL